MGITQTFKGKVVDKTTQQPIAFAAVQANNKKIITDSPIIPYLS